MSARASRANRRDRNEAELVSFWNRLDCVWIPQEPGAGFDGILIAPNGVHIVEVKNAAYAWELTHDESLMKIRIQEAGQEYRVIQTLEEAARLIDYEIEA